MRNFLFLFLFLFFGLTSCTKEPLYNELIVGNEYYVENELGVGLYNWKFFEDGTLRESSAMGFSSKEYSFKWEGGIKALCITTLSVTDCFSVNYANGDELIYLTNLSTFQVLTLTKF